MKNSHHLKNIKSQYLISALTDHREIWHDDDIGPMNFTLPLVHYAYCFE